MEGLKNGEGEYFCHSGVISRGNFKNNQRHGLWNLYANGKIFAKEVYEEDLVIHKDVIDPDLSEKFQFKLSSPKKQNEEDLHEEQKMEKDVINQPRSSQLIKTENSEFGLKTLSLIENFENLNSINLKVFEKNSQFLL